MINVAKFAKFIARTAGNTIGAGAYNRLSSLLTKAAQLAFVIAIEKGEIERTTRTLLRVEEELKRVELSIKNSVSVTPQ